MKRKKFKNIIKFKTPALALSVFWGVLVLMFAGTMYAFAVWNNPGCDPNIDPALCNTSTPLNVSGTGQTKTGGLTLNTAGAPYGLIVSSGRVGIGTTTPSQTLHVNGTAQ
ncbi:MAG: hypothetical protein WD712_02745, partial [Candidatus Spechtbacterales bacterium]